MADYADVWRARLRLLRPGNAAMAAGGVAIGILVAVADPAQVPRATWLAAPLSAFLVTAFGNVLNDLADRRTDARAHPERALPSGAIRPAQAATFAVLLLAVGLIEAWLAAGAAALAFAAANAALLAAYEWRLKALGLPGNLLVGALVGSAFLYGAVAAGAWQDALPAWAAARAAPAAPPAPLAAGGLAMAGLLAAMAGLATVGREVTKDVQDAAADAPARRTLPHRIGAGRSLLVAFFFTNAAVVVSVAALAARPDWWPGWMALLAAADLSFLLGASFAWVDAGKAQRALKGAMLLALAAFALGPLLRP